MPTELSEELKQGLAIREFMRNRSCGYRRAAAHFKMSYEDAKRIGIAARKHEKETAKASRARAQAGPRVRVNASNVDDVTREAFLRSQLQEVADNLVRVQEASKPSWIAIRDFRKQLIDLRRELDEHLAEINKTQEEEIPSNDETLAAIAQIMTNDLSLTQLETIAKLAMTRIGWSQ